LLRLPHLSILITRPSFVGCAGDIYLRLGCANANYEDIDPIRQTLTGRKQHYIYTAIKTVRLSVTEVGLAHGWAWSTGKQICIGNCK